MPQRHTRLDPFEHLTIKTVDVFYRVSTRAQEATGESLFNQRREVEEMWAQPRGITIRRRIEVAESAKGALRLSGAGFKFSKRAEYTQLIIEYQAMKQTERPDAIVIDWVDRWSRNVLEYSGLVSAFRALGIRLLAVGDRLDLTDPHNDLVAHVRAAIGQEQVRITREKVSEARRSRRERGKWQGGNPPDGYRTHNLECPGLTTRYKETPDGKRHASRVRGCNCDETVFQRDPARSATIATIWKLLLKSPLSWAGMAEDVSLAGLVRPNGKPYRWHDLYRIGENPHYAGIMTTNRFERDPHDGVIKKRRPLSDQTLIRDSEAIVEPYVTEERFWGHHDRRYNSFTRSLQRSSKGNGSELTGLLFCPECEKPMSSVFGISSKKTGHGNPRLFPRKRYVWMWCTHAQGRNATCGNIQRVRVGEMSRQLVEEIARIAVLSDDAILAALKLQRLETSTKDLTRDRQRLVKSLETIASARHTLTTLFASGSLSKTEVEEELFAYRRDKAAAEARIHEIDERLTSAHAQLDFTQARNIIHWLRDSWAVLVVAEKAESLRLMVRRVSYLPNGTSTPEHIRVLEYGVAFTTPSIVRGALATSTRARKSS